VTLQHYLLLKSLINLLLKSVGQKKVLSKTFTLDGNYRASDLYMDTLNHEKKIINELIEAIATQILTDLNLIYGEK